MCEDTGGSCRAPAIANGIFGLRPTLGCYNYSDALVLATFTRDTVGKLFLFLFDSSRSSCIFSFCFSFLSFAFAFSLSLSLSLLPLPSPSSSSSHADQSINGLSSSFCHMFLLLSLFLLILLSFCSSFCLSILQCTVGTIWFGRGAASSGSTFTLKGPDTRPARLLRAALTD